jgi:hypothetical protein
VRLQRAALTSDDAVDVRVGIREIQKADLGEGKILGGCIDAKERARSLSRDER